MISSVEIATSSPEETQDVGRLLGEISRPGDVFLLVGNLGSGKTCLTQGIAWGLGVKERARSPTFVLVNEYKGRLSLYHVDLYRLDDVDEIWDLGLDEYLFGEGVCVVEWAEKALYTFPSEHVMVRFEYLDENERRLSLTGVGERGERLVCKVGEKLSRSA